MGIDPGILFPFGDHVDSNGNLKAGGKGIGRYLFPFGDNVDSNGNVKPRGGGKLAGGYYGPGGNADGSGQGQAQQSPGIGPYQGHGTADVPRPSQPTGEPAMGGDNTRTNPNGVTQTGKQMTVSAAFVPEYANSSFNDLLARVNNSGYQPYSSNQLPTTAGNPDAATTPKTQAILAGIQAGKETDMSIEGYQAPASTQPSARGDVLNGIRGGARTDRGIQGTSTAADGVFAGIQGGRKTDQGIEGYKNPGSTSRLDAALNDKAGMQSYMSKFSSGDQERAANRAFLDTEGSMAGLRAKEAVNGVVYAGGQHYMSGTSGDDKAIGIDRSQARDISNGRSTAQGLLDAHIAKNKKPAAESTPVEQQAPAVLEQASQDQAFKQDKPILSESAPAVGGAIEFDTNNSDTLSLSKASEVYKSKSTYKDPVFPNPFER